MTDRALVTWQPERFMDEHHANRLYALLIRKAISDIEAERVGGSEYPKRGSMAWRACVAERAYKLAENWSGAGEVAGLSIARWIQRGQLFFYHPSRWASVEQMLTDISDDVSASGKSVYTRLAARVIPFLQEHGIARPEQVAASLMPGGMSARGKWYHATPALCEAVRQGNVGAVGAMVSDILDESQDRQAMLSKWRGELPIPPAVATLSQNGDGRWHLEVVMDEGQKRLIMGRLGDRVKVSEP